MANGNGEGLDLGPRREYGTGSIYKRATDGRWVGTIEAGYTATGSRRRIPVTAKTKAEVQRKLRDKRHQLETQGLPSVGGRVTVKKWSETWLEMQTTRLRPKAYRAAASPIKKWVIPTIGHRRLEDLTPADIRAVATAQRAAGLKSSTASTTHWVLMGMLKAAIIEGHQVPPRVTLIRPPAQSVSDRDALAPADALKLLKIASTLPHGMRWELAMIHGMRQGECLGLTWDALDLDAGKLIIAWQLQAIPYLDPTDHTKGFQLPDRLKSRHLVDGWHLIEVKSRKGFRAIPLSPAEVDGFRRWREVWDENPYDLVFTRNARPINDKQDRREFWAMQDAASIQHPAGRRFHVHEGRHTAITRLQEEGADEHTIQSQVGHASIATSRQYMHTSTDAQREVLERVHNKYDEIDTTSPDTA